MCLSLSLARVRTRRSVRTNTTTQSRAFVSRVIRASSLITDQSDQSCAAPRRQSRAQEARPNPRVRVWTGTTCLCESVAGQCWRLVTGSTTARQGERRRYRRRVRAHCSVIGRLPVRGTLVAFLCAFALSWGQYRRSAQWCLADGNTQIQIQIQIHNGALRIGCCGCAQGQCY